MIMTAELRKDLKFYTSLFLGFGLALLGCLVPPIGVIETSMLWVVFSFLILSACIEGVDIKGIIQEIRLLKEFEFNNNRDNSISQKSE